MPGWQSEPFAIEVKKGESKAFCMCGQSKNGPYCDGTHTRVGGRPHVEKFDADKTIYVCGCQQSGNRPYCDGTHETLAG